MSNVVSKGIPLLARLEAEWRDTLGKLANVDDAGARALIAQECSIAREIAAEPANSLAELAFKARVVIRETASNVDSLALRPAKDFPPMEEWGLDSISAPALSLAFDLIRLAERGEQP